MTAESEMFEVHFSSPMEILVVMFGPIFLFLIISSIPHYFFRHIHNVYVRTFVQVLYIYFQFDVLIGRFS